jgi:para-nitrobenzyl esterase
MKKAEQAVEFVLMLILTAISPPVLLAAGPRVMVDTGLVEGKRQGAVDAFLGIPYAAPPRHWA